MKPVAAALLPLSVAEASEGRLSELPLCPPFARCSASEYRVTAFWGGVSRLLSLSIIRNGRVGVDLGIYGLVFLVPIVSRLGSEDPRL